MEETFKRIPPEDVFITVFKRKPTEEELWMGVPPDFDGNRPSGNNLIDLFAYLIRKYGRMDTSEYARIMQLKTSELRAPSSPSVACRRWNGATATFSSKLRS